MPSEKWPFFHNCYASFIGVCFIDECFIDGCSRFACPSLERLESSATWVQSSSFSGNYHDYDDDDDDDDDAENDVDENNDN